MTFNPDPNKQTPKVIFSWKLQVTNHHYLNLNHDTVSLTESQKYLGIVLDFGIDFKEHQKLNFKKVSKTIGLPRKFRKLLPRKLLITVYKSFIRPYLVYSDIIYDQAYDASFHGKLEAIWYNFFWQERKIPYYGTSPLQMCASSWFCDNTVLCNCAITLLYLHDCVETAYSLLHLVNSCSLYQSTNSA